MGPLYTLTVLAALLARPAPERDAHHASSFALTGHMERGGSKMDLEVKVRFVVPVLCQALHKAELCFCAVGQIGEHRRGDRHARRGGHRAQDRQTDMARDNRRLTVEPECARILNPKFRIDFYT
jgi:hypothetical protein